MTVRKSEFKLLPDESQEGMADLIQNTPNLSAGSRIITGDSSYLKYLKTKNPELESVKRTTGAGNLTAEERQAASHKLSSFAKERKLEKQVARNQQAQD